eukprot:jgi/Phyca11/126525/e_gw1.63.198.1
MSLFYRAVGSSTEAAFEINRGELRALSVPLSRYLDQHWWKYKKHIVRAWTDQYKHFGIRDTSFVEGTHAKCKRWLRGCQGDLFTVYKNLLPWWNSAASSTRLLAQRNSVRVPYLLQGNRFAAVVRVISVWALTQTHALWEDARVIVFNRLDRGECSGVFRAVHGRPCIHELMEITASNGERILQPRDFDLHWWINREQASTIQPRIQGPAFNEGESMRRRQRRRSRRISTLPYNTRRDPVFFERVDLNNPATPPASSPDRYQNAVTRVSVVNPVSTLPVADEQDPSVFHTSVVPPRFWGYARWS